MERTIIRKKAMQRDYDYEKYADDFFSRCYLIYDSSSTYNDVENVNKNDLNDRCRDLSSAKEYQRRVYGDICEFDDDEDFDYSKDSDYRDVDSNPSIFVANDEIGEDLKCLNSEYLNDKFKYGIVRYNEYLSVYRDSDKHIRLAAHDKANVLHDRSFSVVCSGDVSVSSAGLMGGINAVPLYVVEKIDEYVSFKSFKIICGSSMSYNYLRDLKIQVVTTNASKMRVTLRHDNRKIAVFWRTHSQFDVFSFRTDYIFKQSPYLFEVKFDSPSYVSKVIFRGSIFTSETQSPLMMTHSFRVRSRIDKKKNENRAAVMEKLDCFRSYSDNLLSLDCEFGCDQYGRNIIIRASMVDHNGYLLFDHYIFDERVADTRYDLTGLTHFDLLLNGVSLCHVQSLVQKLSVRKIIVGHTMAFETQELGVSYVSRYDLSKLPLRPVSLRFMYYYYTGRIIQLNVHNSVEDARASLVVLASMNNRYLLKRPAIQLPLMTFRSLDPPLFIG